MASGLIARLAAALLAIGAAGAATAAPVATAERCRFKVEGVKLECGQLRVPQNRTDPDDRRVQSVGYVVLKSRSPSPAADPLVFLTGGPGASAFYFLNTLARSALLENRDIIAIEQRGNGYSEPNLLCDVGGPKTADAARVAFGRCHDSLVKRGVPLPTFNLTEAAADLADLKAALKIARWNVLGTSYGSFWALRYIANHPDGIRSAILDSPYPAQADGADSWIAHMNGLSAIFAACAADAACATAYPDLRARFIGLIEMLDKQPIEAGKARYGASDVFDLVHGANFETATALLVPRLIDAILRQDFKTVQAIASLDPYGRPKGFDIRKAYSAGLNVNSPCIDDHFPGAPDARLKLAEAWPEPLLRAGKASAPDKAAFCGKEWRVAAGPAALNEPVASDLPVLVTVGALDPETPPILGEVMARTLPNATLAVLPDAAHAALSIPTACTSRILAAFLAAPGPKADIACLADDRPRFSLPGEPIAMPAFNR